MREHPAIRRREGRHDLRGPVRQPGGAVRAAGPHGPGRAGEGPVLAVRRGDPAAAVAGRRGERVDIWGGEAQVRLGGDTVFLTQTHAGWRVVAAVCEERGEAPYDCEVEGS